MPRAAEVWLCNEGCACKREQKRVSKKSSLEKAKQQKSSDHGSSQQRMVWFALTSCSLVLFALTLSWPGEMPIKSAVLQLKMKEE